MLLSRSVICLLFSTSSMMFGTAFQSTVSRTAATQALHVAGGVSSPFITRLYSSSESVATTAPFVKPERVVLDTLPTLYVYDHCPFCVRVRVAFGYKNVKHNLFFLANDDKITPTKLVGKKIAPIFQFDELIMPESLDIIRYVDSQETFGTTNMIKTNPVERKDIKNWQDSVRDLLRGLQRPRYVATGLLPEFQQRDGRNAFIMNHQMAPYEKKEWKSDVSAEQKLQMYAEALAKDPTSDVEELNQQLKKLDDMLHCEYYCSDVGGISYDDIDLFSRLRSITIIKNVEWPTKLRKYMDYMSELTDVPLYDEMAL